jgi:hypothetical protein
MEVFAPLVRNLVRVVFTFRAAAKYKRREVVAHEYFKLAGPTGLEPTTSGVTGRRPQEAVEVREVEQRR